MLAFVFGSMRESVVHPPRSFGRGGLSRVRPRPRALGAVDRPSATCRRGRQPGQTTYRSITVDGEEIEFSGGFTDLHTQSYQAILAGHGFGLDAARPSIEAVSAIRTAPVEPGRGERHPDIAKVLAP